MGWEEGLEEREHIDELYEVEKVLEVWYRHPERDDVGPVLLRLSAMRVIKGSGAPDHFVCPIDACADGRWHRTHTHTAILSATSADQAIAQVLGFLRTEVPKFSDSPWGKSASDSEGA